MSATDFSLKYVPYIMLVLRYIINLVIDQHRYIFVIIAQF